MKMTNAPVANKVKSVDDWLDEVRYDNDALYVPSKLALLVVNMIKLIKGGAEENKTPVLHYRMLDKMLQMDSNYIRTANLVFRGAAKTTLVKYLILTLAVHGGKLDGFIEIPWMMYISDSIENGVKTMRNNLQSEYENSEFLLKMLPKVDFTINYWQFTNIAGDTFNVKAYGARTGIRGTTDKGKRPILAVLDDIISDEDAKSAAMVKTIEDNINKAVEYALHPKKSIVLWMGTPFNQNDPLYKAIESGAWTVNAFPVCEKFPCTRNEFSGAWPDRFDFDAINARYKKAVAEGRAGDFYQELMLRVVGNDERIILDEDIKWYRSHEKPELLNYYVTTDFATSEKDGSDYSVIAVWGYCKKGHWWLVDGVCKRQLMNQNINDLFMLVQKYNPVDVGIEVTGQQGAFISWLQDEMGRRNCWFSLAKGQTNGGKVGIRPTVSKMERFNIVVPWFKKGEIHLPAHMELHPLVQEMVNELKHAKPTGFTSKHDDVIDTISMLAEMNAWLPVDTCNDGQDEFNPYGSGGYNDVGSYISSYSV